MKKEGMGVGFLLNIFKNMCGFVLAVLLALVIRTFAYEPYNIPSGSMFPTLLIGDHLFISGIIIFATSSRTAASAIITALSTNQYRFFFFILFLPPNKKIQPRNTARLNENFLRRHYPYQVQWSEAD